MATRLISRLNESFGSDLTLKAVFEGPAAADLALRIVPACPVVNQGIGRLPRDGRPIPLSFAQQRLWLIDQLAPGHPAYNIPAAVRLTGRLDRAVLAASLTAVVARHEALRTTFPTVDGRPLQRIHEIVEGPPFDLPLVDLAALPDPGPEVRCLGEEILVRPFDLVRGPLVHGILLRLGTEDHAALMVMHHIVCDAWSIGVLIDELAALYPELAARRPSPLPPLPVQYADFTVWQREQLTGATLEAQLGYWHERLADAPPLLELPVDRPRPALPSGRGFVRQEVFPARLAADLGTLARREGATLFMVLLAAFAAWLHRLTGHDDLVVGTPIANRTRPELEGLIGFFVNTLALRTDLSGAPTFLDLVGRVREAALGAYAHQDLPFERLVEDLAPERSAAGAPLFQVMLLLHNTPLKTLELPGLRLSPFDFEASTAKFDLTLSFLESEAGLEAFLEASSDLFDEPTAVRMLGQVRELLEGAAAGPGRRLEDLPLLSAAEQAQLLVEWNDTVASEPAGRGVHEIVAARARENPTATAVAWEGGRLTYAELHDQAARLARHLARLGVGPEVLVGVCLDRSPDLVTAVLGVLLAGGSYVPLDPNDPPERRAALLDRVAPAVLLTRRSLWKWGPHPLSPSPISLPPPAGRGGTQAEPFGELATEASTTSPLSRGWAGGRWERGTGGEDPPSPPPLVVWMDDQLPDREEIELRQADPSSLAYVIHTSGSTGEPKGVCIDHAGLLRLAAWYRRAFDLGPGDRCSLAAAPVFDASVLEIWPCLTAGAALCIPPEEVRLSPGRLVRWMAEERITVSFLPTPLAEAVLAEDFAGLGPSLRVLQTGGDRLRCRPPAELPFPLVNLYGPTEVTVVTTGGRVEAIGRPELPPIGRPIGHTAVRVLDPALRPLPIGAAGELWIGGPRVARGYLGRPDLTAERFRPDPWGEPGSRMYGTGDRVRWLPDGRLEFLGRLDAQVKIRGVRLEPGEVEAALRQHPGVRDAAVVARQDGRGGARLVAFVVPAGKEDLPADWRTFLRTRLPDHAVPSDFVLLEALPVTSSGKVDCRALARWELGPDSGSGAPEYVAPASPFEEWLADACATLLGRERVGMRDNFFHLGGHSLLAAQLVGRLREEWQFDVRLQTVFETTTLAELAERILQHELDQVDSEALTAILEDLGSLG